MHLMLPLAATPELPGETKAHHLYTKCHPCGKTFFLDGRTYAMGTSWLSSTSRMALEILSLL